MTIHYSFLDDWIMADELEVGDQSHSAISEYTSGVEQAAALWSRPKRAYDISSIFDADDAAAAIDTILWIKRQLRGQAGRLWLAEKIEEWMVDEYFGTGDGATKGFLVPVFGTYETGYPKVYDAGEYIDINGAESTANEVSEELALASDPTDWTPTNAACYAEANYQWLWTDGCVEVVPSSTAVVTLEAIAGERVAASWPTTASMYATVALRGDVSNDLKVGITQYNSVPAQIDQDFGTATAISLGAWTLVSSGAIPVASGFASAAVTIQSDGTLSTSDELYVGGACLNLYAGGEWFHPSTCPNVVQFGTAPASGNRLSLTARAKRMTRCRLAADNLNHSVRPRGHIEISRLRLLEVVE